MKRIYYLLGIIGTIAVVVGVFYFLHYRSGGNAPTGTTGGTAQTGTLPSAPAQSNQPATAGTQTPSLPGTSGVQGGEAPRFGLVAQNPVLNYFVNSQNEAVLVQPDGQIAKVTTGGPSILSSSAIANLISAEFSYDGAEILATFGGLFAPQGSIFDITGKSWQPLSLGVKSIAWSPDSYQIVYLNNKSGAKFLTTIDTANPKAKPVELITLHIEDTGLSWPAKNKIMLSDAPSSLFRGSIWSFDAKQKTLTPIIEEAAGLESIWSSGADMGLVFYAGVGGNGGRLSLVNAQGSLINSISFLTLPSKCAFDTRTQNQTSPTSTVKTAVTSSAMSSAPARYLYCAIPRDGAKLRTATMPDDYNKKKFFTSDNFYKINLADGNLAQVFSDPSRSLDATNLKIFGDYLFFVNRYDQRLYWISLK